MSRPMSPVELVRLFTYVYEHHNVGSSSDGGKIVKYVDPHFDNRTGDIFSVGFRGYGCKHTIYTSNEQVYNPRSLYDRCIQFLETPYDSIPQFVVGDTVRLEGGEYMTVSQVDSATCQVQCQWFDDRTRHEQWFDFCDVIKVTEKEVEKLKKQYYTSSS